MHPLRFEAANPVAFSTRQDASRSERRERGSVLDAFVASQLLPDADHLGQQVGLLPVQRVAIPV